MLLVLLAGKEDDGIKGLMQPSSSSYTFTLYYNLLPLPVDFFPCSFNFRHSWKLSGSFLFSSLLAKHFSTRKRLQSYNCAHKVNRNMAEHVASCVHPSKSPAETGLWYKIINLLFSASNHLIFISAIFKTVFWFFWEKSSSS